MIAQYIRHRLLSRKSHGIHSPFVYKLSTEVINKKEPLSEDLINIEKTRKELLSDRTIISYSDLGAGSRKSRSNKRPIRELAKNSLKPQRQAQVIYNLIKHFLPEEMLEIGTSLGITSMYMATANPKGRLTTIEGVSQISSIAGKNFERHGLRNITSIEGNFEYALPEYLTKIDHLDLVFIDGNHKKDATLKYFELCLNKKRERSLYIIDDIYWSKEMEEAWSEIVQHKEVTVALDLYHFGIVFFHENQAKENFKLRF